MSGTQIRTRKTGAEHIIMMRLPLQRFQDLLPSHFNPPVDSRSRVQVAMLAQTCQKNSFDDQETGQTDDLHLWLQVGISEEIKPVIGADRMLPTMVWFALGCATSNPSAGKYLKSVGFTPMSLQGIELSDDFGKMTFPDGGNIEWTLSRKGRTEKNVGVNHVVYVPGDSSDAIGHRISALLSDTEMDRLGRVHIKTDVLEPFLKQGEKIAVLVNRASRLKADVTWQRH